MLSHPPRREERKEGKKRRGTEQTMNVSGGFAPRSYLEGFCPFICSVLEGQGGRTRGLIPGYGPCAFTRLGGHLESELKPMSC